MVTLDPIEDAVRLLGLGKLARALGVTHQAVRKWQKARRLPRTEWTGETNYAGRIEKLTHGEVTREQLLAKWPAPAMAAKEAA